MLYKNIVIILKKPTVIIISVISALIIGLYYPEVGKSVLPYGTIFISLLEMCLIPIIVTTIGISITKLFSSKHRVQYLTRIILFFLGAMFSVCIISLVAEILLSPATTLITSSAPTIKEISISASIVDRTMFSPITETTQKKIIEFFISSVPKNIFNSLANNNIFQILVFAIIVGIAVAYHTEEVRTKTVNFFSTTLKIFQKIITSIAIWLPIGVFCLMAGGTSSVGTETFIQTGSLIIKIYIMYGIIFFLSTVNIMLATKNTFIQTLSHLKKPLFIAFGTRSAIIPIPSMIEAFEEKFQLNQSLTKLLVPIGAVLGRFGNIAYFAFISLFIANIYQVHFTIPDYLFTVVLCVLAGLGTTGATGILTLTMITIVLDHFSIPTGAIMPILLAIDAIIDPMRTLVTVYTNCAFVSLIAPKKEINDETII